MAQADQQDIPTFNLLLVGDGGVGKTTFVENHLTRNQPERRRRDFEITPLAFQTNRGPIQFNVRISNIGGEGPFTPFTRYWCQCAIIMFDLASRVTYSRLHMYLRDLFRVNENMPIVIVGNSVSSKPSRVRAGNTLPIPRELRTARFATPYCEISTYHQHNIDQPLIYLGSMLTGDSQLRFLGGAVENHAGLSDSLVGLRSLNLGRVSKSVFLNGWGTLVDYLQTPTCVLEDLDLLGCSFTDKASANLFDALKNNTSLKSLNLAGCLRKATDRTWSSASAMLESEETVLEKLNLCYSPVNNDALYAFSCNLAVNNKMKELLLYNDPRWNNEWKAYSRVLCNTTSINHTFDSNHTLQRVVGNKKQPEGIASLLEMNQGKDAFAVARQKIINVHFAEGYAGLSPFADMELNVLPRALAWMARGGKSGEVEGHLYDFLKSMPTLCGSGSNGKGERED